MSSRRKRNAVTVRGAWLPLPIAFLRSRACAELSPHAVKMLLDLCANLGPNASGNGDLSASPATMRPRGWSSDATRRAALQELEGAGLIAVTKRGNRRACSLFAVALWPLQCDLSKLDHGPGAYTTQDWTKGQSDRAASPTNEAPAIWKAARDGERSRPAAGQPPQVMSQQRDNPGSDSSPFRPAAGSIGGFSGLEVVPPRDTFLELPSVRARTASRTRMGRMMASRGAFAFAAARSPAYAKARRGHA